MTHVHRFLGNSALWWDLKNDVTISAPWYLGLVFRTRAREGTLLQAQAGQYISLVFQVGTNTFSGGGILRMLKIKLQRVDVMEEGWAEMDWDNLL